MKPYIWSWVQKNNFCPVSDELLSPVKKVTPSHLAKRCVLEFLEKNPGYTPRGWLHRNEAMLCRSDVQALLEVQGFLNSAFNSPPDVLLLDERYKIVERKIVSNF